MKLNSRSHIFQRIKCTQPQLITEIKSYLADHQLHAAIATDFLHQSN